MKKIQLIVIILFVGLSMLNIYNHNTNDNQFSGEVESNNAVSTFDDTGGWIWQLPVD